MGRGKHLTATHRNPFRVWVALELTAVVGIVAVSGAITLSDGTTVAVTASARDVVTAVQPVRPSAPSPPSPPTTAEPTATERPSPVSLTVPAIKVESSVVRLGLQADGTVEVPKDPDDAGWYTNGAAPGEKGSAVILGHVDSTTGPAVFYRLKNLKTGDQIEVTMSDGTAAYFRVSTVTQYVNDNFPASEVYDGSPDRPTLNIVTCGGDYDRAKGGYQSNVVVHATYLWATRAR